MDRIWTELVRQRREDILAAAHVARAAHSVPRRGQVQAGFGKLARAAGRVLVRLGDGLDPAECNERTG